MKIYSKRITVFSFILLALGLIKLDKVLAKTKLIEGSIYDTGNNKQ